MGLLADQVCIVTGAGQGLGRTISLEMAAEGAKLALLERNPETLARVAEEIRRNGGSAETYALDITDYDAYGRAVEDVLKKLGKTHIRQRCRALPKLDRCHVRLPCTLQVTPLSQQFSKSYGSTRCGFDVSGVNRAMESPYGTRDVATLRQQKPKTQCRLRRHVVVPGVDCLLVDGSGTDHILLLLGQQPSKV